MGRIKVAVSPFFGGEDWVDEKTGIKFEKNKRGLNVYSIPEELDLSGIRKSIRLNNLIVVEGNVGDFNEIEEIHIDTPVEEIIEEEKIEEPIMEVEEEAPKKKSTKKKSK